MDSSQSLILLRMSLKVCMQDLTYLGVLAVFEALNKVPEEMHGTDVMRVREWYLTDQAKDFRQNILLSSFVSPEMNALFSRLCRSHAGKAKLQPKCKVLLEFRSQSINPIIIPIVAA